MTEAHGTTDTDAPIVVMAVGGLLALSVFVLDSVWVLGVGLATFLGAAIWAGIVYGSPNGDTPAEAAADADPRGHGAAGV